MSRLLDPWFVPELAVKGAVLLAIVGLASLLWRRGPAAGRHLLWSFGGVGLLALPFLALTLPDWHLPVQEPPHPLVSSQPTSESALPGPFAELPPEEADPQADAQMMLIDVALERPIRPGEATAGLAVDEVVVLPPQALAQQSSPQTTTHDWLLMIWMGGAILACLPLLGGWYCLHRLQERSHPLTTGPLVNLLAELRARLDIRRCIVLLETDQRRVPMTWGILRPVILLPSEARSWPLSQARTVLLHELAHIRRWDCLTQLLTSLARALHWFNPLAWMTLARVRTEQEAACDDVVLRSGENPADYAEHLLTVTANLPPGALAATVALAVSRAQRLERRLRGILDPDRDRRPLPRARTSVATLSLMALLVALATGRLQPLTASVAPPIEVAAPGGELAPTPENLLAEIQQIIRDHHVNPPDDAMLAEAAILGLVRGLGDEYAQFLDPMTLTMIQQRTSGELTGIGVLIDTSTERHRVITPFAGSPAMKAGLRPGDEVLAIDGESVLGVELCRASQSILGPEGTPVRITVKRTDGTVEDLTLIRERVKVPTVLGFRRGQAGQWEHLLDPATGIGYINIEQLGPETAGDIRHILQGLRQAGMKGLILDLRFCPGGLLESAIAVCRIFLSGGTIVTLEGQHGCQSRWEADGVDALTDFPMVVLIGDHTASAGEIVAGALSEHGRAVLLGVRSHGKGSVQSLIPLPNSPSALKLTTAYYHLPSGRSIQKRPGLPLWGVDPHDGFWMPLTSDQIKALWTSREQRFVIDPAMREPDQRPITPTTLEEDYADPQLGAALQAMRARLSGGDFPQVGAAGEAYLPLLQRKHELTLRRQELIESLERVDRDLEQIRQTLGDSEEAEQ